MVEVVTSSANPVLKDIRRAQEQGSVTSQGWLIAEGPHLVEEAVESNLKIRLLIATDRYRPDPRIRADRTLAVSDALFRSLSGTETPQGVMVLAEPPQYTQDDLYGACALLVVVDGVQDPGNVGAIARSAEAFGATGIAFLQSANPLSPKALRASAGSLFRIPFLRLPRDHSFRVPRWAAVSVEGEQCWDCDLRKPCAIVIGSEGGGVSPEQSEGARRLRIPTQRVESLNAAMAASILLYEAARQRRSA